MLTQKQISDIKEHLEKAQNPIFFYDNDADGLCSFLLLSRYIERGKGVAVKSYPEMDASYFKKVLELNADYIFILDKPIISEGFWKEIEQHNIPVVWIDHHDVQCQIPGFVDYYNVFLNKPSTNEPVTVLCYQITNRKDDLWIAVIGSISDKFVPEFYDEFHKKFPELSVKSKNAFDILYKSQIGKIARIIGFGLKDSVTNVVKMQRFLLDIKSPYDILEENNKNKSIYSNFNKTFTKYNNLLEKAKASYNSKDKILFFQYAGETSLSSDIANELSYLYASKYIVVFRVAGASVNISMRGKDVKDIIIKSIEGLDGARGGGHQDAVGGKIKFEDLEIFKERIRKIINSSEK